MLDRKFILENLDLIQTNIANRGMSVRLDEFVRLEGARKALLQQVEAVRAEANALAKSAAPVEEKRAQGQQLKSREATLNEQLKQVEAQAHEIYLTIPNLTDPASPAGGEECSLDIARGKTPIRQFDFPVQDHITLMEKHRMLNLAAGAKVAGSGFYYFTGAGALLELALTRFALDHIMKAGYTPVITPDLVRDSLMVGAGFVPRGNESNTYHLEDHDLNLIATSEITLVGMHADEVVDLSQPIKYAGLSHCFRSERAHGSATRGIYRVHQFTKAEMVVICKPEEAEAHHLELRRLEQEIYDALEIPYRVLEIAAGDLGAAAYRKFDLEAWMPARNGTGDWGEITSTSNCTEFQARRLNIRYRDEAGKLQYAATLNGTAVSVCRPIVAIVENNQQADGSIIMPKALQPYLPEQYWVLKA
ncbi:MAG: serine--tRNA ligase [Alphaproteobacteria bacterium]|nr:serine--tRNA ligase [Alphaproteobacteria bacterium]